MTDNNNIQAQPHIPKLDPALKRLEVLVDTWNIKGRESAPDGETHRKVTVAPVATGKGKPFFKDIKDKIILKLFKTKTFNCRNLYFTTILTKRK
jgi:hypothetical protein